MIAQNKDIVMNHYAHASNNTQEQIVQLEKNEFNLNILYVVKMIIYYHFLKLK